MSAVLTYYLIFQYDWYGNLFDDDSLNPFSTKHLQTFTVIVSGGALNEISTNCYNTLLPNTRPGSRFIAESYIQLTVFVCRYPVACKCHHAFTLTSIYFLTRWSLFWHRCSLGGYLNRCIIILSLLLHVISVCIASPTSQRTPLTS